VKDVLLLDVIPLSLGIETMGGVATKIIDKNTTIPASRTQVFSTASDNQPSVEIHIVQGERPLAADNKTLGKFMLDGIPPAPRGMPQVEVTFDVNVNGILSVKAKDKTTNKEQSIRIEARGGLSQEEVEKMKKDAELHAEDDKKRKEEIEARNMADHLIHTAEKALKDAEGKISDTIKSEVIAKIEELKKVKDGNDQAAIKTASESLSTSMSKIGEEMMKNQPKEGTTTGDASASQDKKEDGPVRDADFEEKK